MGGFTWGICENEVIVVIIMINSLFKAGMPNSSRLIDANCFDTILSITMTSVIA